MTSGPQKSSPLAEFTLTISTQGVDLLDHADHSRHHFKNLLSALSHMEMVSESRKRAVQQGHLI